MAEFLIYDLKVAVLIAAFYFCYRLLMERGAAVVHSALACFTFMRHHAT